MLLGLTNISFNRMGLLNQSYGMGPIKDASLFTINLNRKRPVEAFK